MAVGIQMVSPPHASHASHAETPKPATHAFSTRSREVEVLLGLERSALRILEESPG
jgi:hypothetical protein